jgi:hypothetical protein
VEKGFAFLLSLEWIQGSARAGHSPEDIGRNLREKAQPFRASGGEAADRRIGHEFSPHSENEFE